MKEILEMCYRYMKDIQKRCYRFIIVKLLAKIKGNNVK